MRNIGLSHKNIVLLIAALAVPTMTEVSVAQVHLINVYEVTRPMQLELTKFSLLAPSIAADFIQASKASPAPGTLNGVISNAVKLPSIGIDLTVRAGIDNLMDEGFQLKFTAQDVENSAGTFGDPSRFFSTLAGVMTDNDQRNDFLVRGGNPSENLFVVDNIEVPSINQLALSDTTGGFVSMIDAAAITGITLHDDAYSSSYDERLSSVVEISTRTNGRVEPHTEAEMGIAGVGGSMSRPMGKDGSYFLSVRQGVLQYMTNDIGMNGVPKYKNALLRAENRISDHDSWWGMSLTGIDSIAIRPAAFDCLETNPYDISYSGWRNTTGINWQHLFSQKAYGVASASHSEQSQTVAENAQMEDNAIVYNEQSRDSISTVKYDWTSLATSRITVQAGLRGSVDQMNYKVAQPIGLQNPYSSDPTPEDVGAVDRRFAAVTSGAYVEGAFKLKHGMQLTGGERFSQWSFGGHTSLSGKALFSVPVRGKEVHISYSEHAQLPAQLYMLAYNNAQTLKPIQARQVTAGIVAADQKHLRLKIEAYQKWYSDYPVASNYPQLSMANIADTFGQAFLMFPMTGAGKGLARGVEVSAETHVSSKLSFATTAAYARSWYSGLDGVLRRGNYDVPLAANMTGLWKIGRGFEVSGRFNITSGRPYTPDDLALSIAQNRDVYDLNQINGLRSTSYQRLDFRVQQAHKLGSGTLTWHIGLENALDHQNFYSQVWEPRLIPAFYPGATLQQFPQGFLSVQTQMPLFPDGGLKFAF